MAKETQPKPTESSPTTEVAVTAEEEKPPKEEEPMKSTTTDDNTPPASEESVSFKGESNVVADLQDPQKKALDELKLLIRSALANKEFDPPTTTNKEEDEEKAQDPKTQEKAVEPSDSTPAEEKNKTQEAKTEEKVEDPKTDEKTKAEGPKAKEEEEETQEAETEETEEESKTKEKTEERNAEDVKTEESPFSTPVKGEKKTQEAKAEEKTGESKPKDKTEEPLEEIFIWGVPLLGDEKSDTVLLKFLRARDFKVKEAMAMIKNSIIWRKQFGIDNLINQDLEIPELEKAVFNHGFDKEGHPVCYNVFGEFQNKDLYVKAFGDGEKRENFLRWRIQYLEKGIREKLDFSPGGVCSIVQVNDLKNTAGPGKKEFRVATKKALTLLQDNYPEFVAKQVFINVPWWYLAYNMVISSFFTQRSKSKFVFAGPSKSAETLFKYIAPEQVPVQYGGLSKENDPDFTTSDVVTEVTIKPASKHTIEIPATEGSVLIWELRVLGWEVSYGVEFSPNAEDGYTVIVQKVRKFVPTDEPYVKNSFKIGEPGKIILTIDNVTSKKKKLLYRSKDKSWTKSS